MTVRLDLLVLAHQGGWDEIVMVLAPIAVIMGLLVLAKRRIDREQQHRAEPPDAGTAGPT